MARFIDISNQKFGRLTALEISHSKNGVLYWKCKCDCGTTKIAASANIRNGHVKSCKCLHHDILVNRNITHGQAHTAAYSVWRSMMTRCYNKKSKFYYRYGGRGINVCQEWQNFEGFFLSMGHPPPHKTLERINNNEGYYTENCCWADRKRQARNRSSSKMITCEGKTQCLMAWAEETGIRRETIAMRLKHGWSAKDALTLPVALFKNRSSPNTP